MPLTTFDIAHAFAAAFAADRFLQKFAEETHGRPFHISIGADMRRMPETSMAPFIVIFTDSCISGPQRAESSHELGLVAGIDDDAWVEESNGVLVMRGLHRLSAELCPMMENSMRQAVPKARVQELSVDFDIVQFPLCEALMSVTVQESLPVGRR